MEVTFSPSPEPKLSNNDIIQVTGAKALSTFTMERDQCVKGPYDVVTTAKGDGTE